MQGVGAETGSHEDRVPLSDPSCSPFGHIPLEVRAIRGSIADLPSACGVQKSRNCGGQKSGEASVVEEESRGVKAVIPKQ